MKRRTRRRNVRHIDVEREFRRALSAQNYKYFLYGIGTLFLVCVIVVIVLSVTLSAGSGAGAGGGRFLTPAPPVTTTSTSSTSSTTEEFTTTSPPPETTIPEETTTPPPTPISIECPPDITTTFGKSFDPGTIGNVIGGGDPSYFVNVTGGCTTPVVEHVDKFVGVVQENKKKKKKKNLKQDPRVFEQRDRLFEHHVIGMYLGKITTRAMEEYSEISSSLSSRSLYRTPTWPNGTFINSISTYALSNTGAPYPDPTMAAGPSHIMWATNRDSPKGTLITITDPNDVSNVLASFTLSTPSCMAPTASFGESQVLYDQFEDRWILIERSIMNNLCVYVSDTNDPTTTTWSNFLLSFPWTPKQFKLGMWGETYTLTLDAHPSVSPHCFLNKEVLLFGNSGEVLSFCTQQGFENLAGFTSQSWTPLDMEGGPMPPKLIETQNSDGFAGVFLRPRDDELHDSQDTPGFDAIEIVHYTQVNFTANSFTSLRYFVSVPDFDSSTSGLVPQPSGAPGLSPVPQLIMHRAAFRWLPECENTGSAVIAWTSHHNGVDVGRVKWAELHYGITPSLIHRFGLYQEGTISWLDGETRFLPSIAITGNGTIAMIYAQSSGNTNPSVYLTSRAVDDPIGTMRTPQPLNIGTGQHTLSPTWGRSLAMATPPFNSNRLFYAYGVVGSQSVPWVAHFHKLRVSGEIIERTFIASDTCGQEERCTHIITLE